MASSWGNSWGTSWGNSWGDVGAPQVVKPPVQPGGGHKKKRRSSGFIYVAEQEQRKPAEKPLRHLRMPVEAATFAIKGLPVTFDRTFAELPEPTIARPARQLALAYEPGSYSVSGAQINLVADRRLTISPAAFTITGCESVASMSIDFELREKQRRIDLDNAFLLAA